MTKMARSLKEKLATLDPSRRVAIEVEADRLHAECLNQKVQRATNPPT